MDVDNYSSIIAYSHLLYRSKNKVLITPWCISSKAGSGGTPLHKIDGGGEYVRKGGFKYYIKPKSIIKAKVP